MNKVFGMTAIVAMLAACADTVDEVIVPTDETVVIEGENPTDDVTDVVISGGIVTVGGLEAASYDGTELLVQIALDGPDALQAYTLVTDPRSDEYQEYALQISELNRAYTAIAGRSPNGELVAVVAMDGGQFNRFFGGATVIQTQYTRPDPGTLSYAGDYAGLLNFGGDTLPITGDVPGAFAPSGSSEILGKVFFNANFTDNKIEGGMANRFTTIRADETTTYEVQLVDLVFINSDVNADGTFAATTESRVQTALGSYSGAFGGTDAAYVAGIVALNGDFLDGAIAVNLADQGAVDAAIGLISDGNEQEYGIFVIEACGPLGTSCPSTPAPVQP